MRISYYVFARSVSSIFTNEHYKVKLRNKGLIEKRNPFFAKSIICRNMEIAKKAALLIPFKKNVIHQVELSIDTIKTEIVNLYKFKPIVVINGFNKGVYFNNNHFLSGYIYDDDCDLGLKKGELILMSSILSKKEFENAKHMIFIGQKRDVSNINSNNVAIGIDLNLKKQEMVQYAYDEGVGMKCLESEILGLIQEMKIGGIQN